MITPAHRTPSGTEHAATEDGMGGLTTDPAFLDTTYVVIDFESATPRGYPAQPIEVAVRALRYENRAWITAGRFHSLIRPPAFAPVTSATVPPGVTADEVRAAPEPPEAMGALDRRFTADRRYLLVAQHAATEANLIHQQRDHCPALARIDLLDTIPLAKHLLPGLPAYNLDTLLRHFAILYPADRHRATADVDVTTDVFTRLITLADESARITDLAALLKIAGRTATLNQPEHHGLFDL
ncbi:3'-5' exonuclease [Amycolatopsis thailandensis]|nr:exonuclease domain-containing protein [Amycolatopsis thailandensis]